MSKKFLEELFEQELKFFMREGGGNFYRQSAEKKDHIFTVNFQKIRQEIEKELRGAYDELGVRTDLGRLESIDENRKLKYKRRDVTVKDRIDAIISETLVQIRRSLNESFNITLQNEELIEITVTESMTLGKLSYDYRLKKQTPATAFSLISDSFKKPRTNLKDKIERLLSSLGETDLIEKMKKQPLLVTGHIGGSSIIERRVASSAKKIESKVQKFNRSQIAKSQDKDTITEEDLKIIFGDDIWRLYKIDIDPRSSFYVEIESALFNNPKYKKIESNIRNTYIQALAKAQLKIGTDFADRGGSDSRSTIEKKKQIKNFVNGLKKNKRVKVKSIDTKPKYSTGQPVVKRVKKKKSKIKKVSGKKASFGKVGSAIPKTQTNKTTQQPTLNLNALKAQINARLSMTVIKNMGTPALENRTGRFARSAIVTDVVQTSQGFPSIGYTYQKYPYQTFEPGYKQGSVDRDPRALIDRSIREIATQLIVGRFYTRRV